MTYIMYFELMFWVAIGVIFYAYFGYPMLLALLSLKQKTEPRSDKIFPTVSIIIPAHNEEAVIKKKILNTLELLYPLECLEIICISDGSTDHTNTIIEKFHEAGSLNFIQLEHRKGKANALNVGLSKSNGEIIVFSDASISLDKYALENLVQRFSDPLIGCISGEDHIADADGEGLYGRYELYIRNLESKVGSIVGASGSFYAQRKELCEPFVEGVAPDFLSVLNTVEKGFRCISEPKAYGTMTSLKNHKAEFQRKVRTLVRGMAAIFHKKDLLNPFKFGFFSLELMSHKITRWLVPIMMILAFLSNILLLDQSLYQLIFFGQLLFYIVAVSASYECLGIHHNMIGRIALYFCNANLAILVAWVKYAMGIRQEIWQPTKR